jgi:hypothetical protein
MELEKLRSKQRERLQNLMTREPPEKFSSLFKRDQG